MALCRENCNACSSRFIRPRDRERAWGWRSFNKSSPNTAGTSNARAPLARAAPLPSFSRWGINPEMGARFRILLVDDEERLRHAAGKVLTDEGYSVLGAASGREALKLLQEEAFALVISDLRLPDLDGIALLKQARELLPEAEVVMI